MLTVSRKLAAANINKKVNPNALCEDRRRSDWGQDNNRSGGVKRGWMVLQLSISPHLFFVVVKRC